MPHSSGRSVSLLAFAIAAILTAAMAAPVLRAPSERIFGSEIGVRNHDPYTVMRQFAGAPVRPPYIQPVTDLTGKALGRLFPPVAAYNIIVLATFPLAALFGCLLAYELIGSRALSVAAGLAFAFSPFHLAQAVDHPHIAQVQWIPLFLLALWRAVHRFTSGRAALLVVATGLVALSNFYGGLIAAAVAPFALVAFWLVPDRGGRRGGPRDVAATAGLLGAMAAAGLTAIWLVAPTVIADPARYAYHPNDHVRYSASVRAYLTPPADHAVLGPWSQRHLQASRTNAEKRVFVGYAVLVLAAVACAAWPRRREDPRLRVVPALALVGAAALMWSLPPNTIAAGDRWLWPSALVYGLAPMFRAYARFGVVVQLVLVLLAALGAASLLARRTRAGTAVVAILAAGLVFEYAPIPWRWRDVLPTTAHRWLARHAAQPRVFDCSSMPRGDVHTGWLAGYPLQYARPGFDDCADPDAAVRLRSAGLTHAVVRGDDRLFPWLDTWRRSGLELVYRGGDGAVLELRTEAAPPLYIGGMSGVYGREYSRGTTWRWSQGDATLTIVNAGREPRSAVLELMLQSAFDDRRIQVSLNGVPLQELQVPTRRSRFTLGPFSAPPGRSQLRLQSREPPGVPAILTPRNRDRRSLAFAVGEWRWEILEEEGEE